MPSPTSGDTKLPAKKPEAPNRAEAEPACLRALSIASVVEAVKDSPIVNSRANNNPSNIHTDTSVNSPSANNTPKSSMPPPGQCR